MASMKRIVTFGILALLLTPPRADAQAWIHICKTEDIDSTEEMTGNPNDVATIDDTVFVTWGGNLSSYVIVGDTTVDTLDVYSRSQTEFGNMVIDDGDAFLASGSQGLSIVRVSDADDLRARDVCTTTAFAWDVDIGGENADYAFVAVDSMGLQILDVFDRDSIGDSINIVLDLTVIDTIVTDTTVIDTFPVVARAVHAHATNVHVVGGGEVGGDSQYASYHIVDVFDADSPKVVAQWVSNDWSHFSKTTQMALDVVVKAGYTYLAVDDDDLFVFSNSAYEDTVADTSCYPCYLKTVNLTESAMGLDIGGDYLYVAAQGGGRVSVFYLGDPTTPKFVGTYYPGYGVSNRVYVDDERIILPVHSLASSTPTVQILCHEFFRGDVDDSGEFDNDDVDDLTDYVFYGLPTPEPGEWNGDVKDTEEECDKNDPTVNAADVIHLNNFVNNGGDPPDCTVELCEHCD